MKRFGGAYGSKGRSRKKLDTLKIAGALVLIVSLAITTNRYESVFAGEGILLALGLVALVTRFPSIEVFKLALAMLIFIPVSAGLLLDDDTADAFGVYAFITLSIGVVLALIETVGQKPDYLYMAPGRKKTGKH